MSSVLKINVPIAATSLLLFSMVLVWMKFSKGKSKNAIASEILLVELRFITCHELVRATDSFRVTNLVGEGSSAMVLRVSFLMELSRPSNFQNPACEGTHKL